MYYYFPGLDQPAPSQAGPLKALSNDVCGRPCLLWPAGPHVHRPNIGAAAPEQGETACPEGGRPRPPERISNPMTWPAAAPSDSRWRLQAQSSRHASNSPQISPVGQTVLVSVWPLSDSSRHEDGGGRLDEREPRCRPYHLLPQPRTPGRAAAVTAGSSGRDPAVKIKGYASE